MSSFAELKINSVRIVNELNNSDMFHLPISVMAVKQEESNIEKCYLKNAFNSRIDILSRYNEFNMHTIVCHNVGCHLDIFGSRTASFENKAIFKVKSKSINHKNIG